MDINIFSNEGSLYRITEWITRLVYVNLLWILFTLLGLIIFGVMPSTLAVFVVIKKWLSGQENVKVFSLFWETYKSEFIRINIIGIVMLIIGTVLVFDLIYVQEYDGIFYLILRFALYFLLFLYFIDLSYLFPIYIKYDLKMSNILKNALFFAFITPKETLQLVLGLAAVSIFFRFLPSLLPFLSISLPVYVISWISSKTIVKVEEKLRQNKK
ncbi:MAG: YesL family protein [Halanaerobiales bacterium]